MEEAHPEKASREVRADESVAAGREAFERLLLLAEKRYTTDQTEVVAEFIAVVMGFGRFDLYDFRYVDADIAEDIWTCIETIRWRKARLADLVPDGWARGHAIASAGGFVPNGL